MIQFNQVTWYSKLASLIVLLIALPIITFFIGAKYQDNKNFFKAEAQKERDFIVRNEMLASDMKQKMEDGVTSPALDGSQSLVVGDLNYILALPNTEFSVCPVLVTVVDSAKLSSQKTNKNQVTSKALCDFNLNGKDFKLAQDSVSDISFSNIKYSEKSIVFNTEIDSLSPAITAYTCTLADFATAKPVCIANN
jgi:hypothetical protein